MRKVIVVGGSGLIGSALCEVLFEAGFNVVGMSRNPAQEKVRAYTSEWIIGDISTSEGIEKLHHVCLSDNNIGIVLCCGNHGEDSSISNQIDTYNTNVIGVTRIWEMLNSGNKSVCDSVLICSSLMSSLPDRHYPFYAASKAGVDQFVRSLKANSLGVTMTSLVLGPVGTDNRVGMRSAKEVARVITKHVNQPKFGILYYPHYLRVLRLLILLYPSFWETVLLKFRKIPK